MMWKKAIIGGVVAGGVGLAGWSTLDPARAVPSPAYQTASVEQGPLVSTITATGALGALVTVEVGSQLSGLIAEVTVDFNSRVEEGQVLARLNGDQLAAREAQAAADVQAAVATLVMQQAAVDKALAEQANAEAAAAVAQAQGARARLAMEEAQRDFDRREELRGRGVIAAADLEKAETQLHTTQALLAAARAQERQAQAAIASAEAARQVATAQADAARSQIAQKEAALQLVKVDVARAVIRSPIDGVVVDRAVNPGQTVAASLQAPKLFIIAQDLRRMQVLANVNEADIGKVRPGQPVSFTVAAFPERIFRGTVAQVRLAPKEEQNVVTYIVAAEVDNADLALLPGMTANLTIIADERSGAVKIPNAALRFRPPGAPPPEGAGGGKRTVWVTGAQGGAKPLLITPGLSDGGFTEMAAGELTAGDRVIIGMARHKDAGGRVRLGF
jgi:HlyD family secretion protein